MNAERIVEIRAPRPSRSECGRFATLSASGFGMQPRPAPFANRSSAKAAVNRGDTGIGAATAASASR